MAETGSIKNACEHLIREGVCGANLDVCCVYQNCDKYKPWDPEWGSLHSIRETWCTYPNVSADTELARAIHDITADMQRREKQ